MDSDVSVDWLRMLSGSVMMRWFEVKELGRIMGSLYVSQASPGSRFIPWIASFSKLVAQLTSTVGTIVTWSHSSPLSFWMVEALPVPMKVRSGY